MRLRVLALSIGLFVVACGPSQVLISTGPNQGQEAMPSAEVCPLSHPCQWGGSCGFDPNSGECVVRDDADCAQSMRCDLTGKCTYDDEWTHDCIVGSVADCIGHSGCTEHNRCEFDMTHGNCVEECAPLVRCETALDLLEMQE